MRPFPNRKTVRAPKLPASDANLAGYGYLVNDPEAVLVEIVTWPAPGWRPVDAGTGNEAGTTEGEFDFWWHSGALHGRNNAVNDEYVLAWMSADDDEALIAHANYHPDGGQLFFPLNGEAFVIPLANTGDDLALEDFVAFYCDGSAGVYIHPGVWHEALLPMDPKATFFDKQGKVHARISSDFETDFGAYLGVPMTPL
jgi:hypothetical protein